MYLHPIVLAILAVLIIVMLLLIFVQFREQEESQRHIELLRRQRNNYLDHYRLYQAKYETKVHECDGLYLRNAELSAIVADLDSKADVEFHTYADEALAVIGEQPALPGLELVHSGREL